MCLHAVKLGPWVSGSLAEHTYLFISSHCDKVQENLDMEIDPGVVRVDKEWGGYGWLWVSRVVGVQMGRGGRGRGW